ncbi:MAG: 4-hydroxyphenylpyruvate dioxygenase [Pseudomonadales bacterium]|nr:4-hydroxyphenylpyruvate dioxygenase [Pseudomonadales bacterium]
MNTTSSTPCTTQGFAFVEFVSSEPEQMDVLFRQLGFQLRGHTATGDKRLYSQGAIYFIVNRDSDGSAGRFARQHRQGVSGVGFLIQDPRQAWQICRDQGTPAADPPDYPFPALQCIGGCTLYLLDQSMLQQWMNTELIPAISPPDHGNQGLTTVDHLTHNVRRGQLPRWEAYYQDQFGFQPIRRFDIKGSKTGLRSVALVSPCGNIRIPINESSDAQSQIEEFIQRHQGEGVQHIALSTDDIYATVRGLRRAGVSFQSTPDTYYQALDQRLPDHGEDTVALQELGILLDADRNQSRPGKLLQIFTKETMGPLFFEVIQRKGNQGFGEGNFQALFESIELDQMQRGVI